MECLLRTFPCANVTEHNANDFSTIILRGSGGEVCPDGRAAVLHHSQFAVLRFTGREELFVQEVVTVRVLFLDEAGERLLDEITTRNTQKGGSSEVGL